jgi:1-deoxy-D-xylulose-5-phosphate reductoisomerase
MEKKNFKPVNVAVIGCTGSVGSSVMEVCRLFPEKFNVVTLAAQSNVDRMLSLYREFHPSKIVMTDPESAKKLENILPDDEKTIVLTGKDSLLEAFQDSPVDHVVFASSGTSAIMALKLSLKLDLDVSLANKESIVLGGPWIMPLVTRKGQLRPLDSEHNAIWQCIMNEKKENIKKIYLTASGGPFLDLPSEEFKNITPAKALQHPVWKMGSKISIDSATLMNKGIELMEAMYLFDMKPEQLSAVIHPDAFVHGMVQFCDNTLKMSAANASMLIPASVCLAFPERLSFKGKFFEEPVVHDRILNFRSPDLEKFPCLALAIKAMKMKGPYPALVLGADEGAVESFLTGQRNFSDIYSIIDTVVSSYSGGAPSNIEEAVDIFRSAKEKARELCKK